MATQALLPGVEDRAVWVTCPSCGGIWCRTHETHIDWRCDRMEDPITSFQES